MGMLSLNRTVYDLCREEPGLVEVLASCGFDSIQNPVMMRTAARVMTIPKAADMKGIALEFIIQRLEEAGYQILKGASECE